MYFPVHLHNLHDQEVPEEEEKGVGNIIAGIEQKLENPKERIQ
jgi:hypothetical protein